jgi:hypothetical protein
MTQWNQETVTSLVCNNSDLTYDDVLRITGLSPATLNIYLSQSIMGCHVLSKNGQCRLDTVHTSGNSGCLCAMGMDR